MVKLEELAENEEFVTKLNGTETDEDVKNLLTEYDVDIPNSESEELTEEEMKSVAGGAVFTVAGLTAAFLWVWSHGGGAVVTSLINPKTIRAYYICQKANSDYNRGNMYRTYSEGQVRDAMNTLDNALKKFGY